MGCSQSHLCTHTLSQSQARDAQPKDVRQFPVDPEKAAESKAVKAAAMADAERMLDANKHVHFRDVYVRATLVSFGGSARVFTAVNKHTNETVAIKIITKSVKNPELQRSRVLQEMGAMLRVQHHPHAVKLLDVYEDTKAYQLIMELLQGGELFEHITHRAAVTEATAAAIGRSLLQYLAHAHGLGVAHMDIKPENIMFDSQGADGVLKVIDTGSAEFVCQGQEVPHAFGTVRYSSPEMAAHSAGPASDVWSAGIVLCQVLTGRVPFLKDTDLETLNYIKKGPEAKLTGSAWRSISPAAKECIRSMLQPDPAARPSASQLLLHPWLAAAAPQTAIPAAIVHQLQLFAGLSRARRVVLGAAAKNLTGAEASRLLRQFLAFDTDFNGTLDYQELALATKQAAPDLSEVELQRLFAALDVDNTGSVDAQEFFAGVLQVSLPLQQAQSLIEESFKTLDRASKGHLTPADLTEGLRLASPSAFQALHTSGSLESELAQEFAAMDTNGDGVVTLDEFKAALSVPAATVAGGRPAASLDWPLDAPRRLQPTRSCKT